MFSGLLSKIRLHIWEKKNNSKKSWVSEIYISPGGEIYLLEEMFDIGWFPMMRALLHVHMIGNQSLKCARNRLTMWSFSSKRISSKTLSKVENFEELDSSFAGKMRKRKFYFKNATSGSGLVHRRLRTIVLFAPRGNILSLACAQRQCIAGSGYLRTRSRIDGNYKMKLNDCLEWKHL